MWLVKSTGWSALSSNGKHKIMKIERLVEYQESIKNNCKKKK
jgi:hypothetical protein